MTLNEYDVDLSIQARRDAKQAVFYKKELGTREDNLEKFKEIFAQTIQRLKTSPKVGSNLSARMDIETSVKYLPIQDYLLFYEILEGKNQVNVIRLLPAKTNWMSKIMKSVDQSQEIKKKVSALELLPFFFVPSVSQIFQRLSN